VNDKSFRERTDPIREWSWNEAHLGGCSRIGEMTAPIGAIEAVLFDYSGVMTTSLGLPDDDLGCDRDALATEMLGALANQSEHPWHELERGEISLDAFLAYMESTVRGSSVLFAVDSPLNAMATLELLDHRIAVVRSVAARGCRVALVTNNVAEWEPLWKPRLPADLFEAVIDSSMVGSRKPEPGIYQAALGVLEVEATSAVFVDDFEWNVVGATALGMHGLHCTPDTDLGAELDALLLV